MGSMIRDSRPVRRTDLGNIMRPEYMPGYRTGLDDFSDVIEQALEKAFLEGGVFRGRGINDPYPTTRQVAAPRGAPPPIFDLGLKPVFTGTNTLNCAALNIGAVNGHAPRTTTSAAMALYATSVTVADASIFAVGDDVHQVDPNQSIGGMASQPNSIVAIDGNTLTFATPAIFAYGVGSYVLRYYRGAHLDVMVHGDANGPNLVGVVSSWLADATQKVRTLHMKKHGNVAHMCLRRVATIHAIGADEPGAGYADNMRSCNHNLVTITGRGNRHMTSNGSGSALFDSDISLRILAMENTVHDIDDQAGQGSPVDDHVGTVNQRYGHITGAVASDAPSGTDFATFQGTGQIIEGLRGGYSPRNGILFQPDTTFDGKVEQTYKTKVILRTYDTNDGVGFSCDTGNEAVPAYVKFEDGFDCENYRRGFSATTCAGDTFFKSKGDFRVRSRDFEALRLAPTNPVKIEKRIYGDLDLGNTSDSNSNCPLELNGQPYAAANGGAPGVEVWVKGDLILTSFGAAREGRIRDAIVYVEGKVIGNPDPIFDTPTAGGFSEIRLVDSEDDSNFTVYAPS